MRFGFSKMHGLGNDFVVLDGTQTAVNLTAEQIRFIADRRLGIGCDQLLLVEPSSSADFRYRIFNADGGEVEQCGNGARCFADFVYRRGLSDAPQLRLETNTGFITVSRISGREQRDSWYSVDMGQPILLPERIPFIAPTEQSEYELALAHGTCRIGAVSMGNPHAVLLVDDVDTAPVSEWGPEIERHARFPRRVNVGFLAIQDPQHVRLRVWERGVGETSACGTGACAAVVSGRLRGHLAAEVHVQLSGGELQISWPGPGESVTMRGPATAVFDGVIEL